MPLHGCPARSAESAALRCTSEPWDHGQSLPGRRPIGHRRQVIEGVGDREVSDAVEDRLIVFLFKLVVYVQMSPETRSGEGVWVLTFDTDQNLVVDVIVHPGSIEGRDDRIDDGLDGGGIIRAIR